MTNREMKEVEDFVKDVMGTAYFRSLAENIDLDDYEHWLRVLYWSLGVYDPAINRMLNH